MDEKKRIKLLPYRLPEKICELMDGFKKAVQQKNTTAVFIIDGRSGLGKTTLANQLGKYLDPNFDLPNIYFEPKQFLEGLANAKPYTFHLFDEAMVISNRSALTEINRMVTQAMSMIRSKNLFVCFCVNSIFDLDKNLALHRADILFHIYGDSLTDRGKVMGFFKGSDGLNRLKRLWVVGKRYYSYAIPKSNFYTRFSSHFVVDEIEYERLKQEGVNNFLRSSDKKRWHKDTKIKDTFCYNLKEKADWNAEDIAEYGGLSQRSVYDCIRRYKKFSYEKLAYDTTNMQDNKKLQKEEQNENS